MKHRQRAQRRRTERPRGRRLRVALVALLTALASAGSVVTATAPVHADAELCGQWATTVQGQYVVQNNRWGTSAEQCVETTGSGFRVTRADGSVSTSGPPKSYPSVYLGCHYTNCSPGSPLPAQISGIGSLNSSVTFGYVGGAIYDAAYDIWLDPTPRKDGVNRTEIMIWFNRVGQVQPVGRAVGTATVGGRSWEVWTGNNGGNDVISFVAPAAISGWSFDVMDFVDQAIGHGLATSSWYVTSVQAGFEPWQNGAGLSVGSFSATVDGGGPPPEPAGTCEVGYGTNSWSSGFTANVTVTNTGGSPVNGWSLGFTLPPGQAVANAWNAAVSSAGGAVTARNLDYNATIPPGGSQSFGFQGTHSGTFASPDAFTLNGTRCTVS
ncbi:cellulose binding domain-containing protein [Spirillospora sp. NPDC047279]|uniref:GH12 family glycosyl hydrolase domain-containing protein n=1 Tax=Spirillospora sp. NPDC047279 TaxID=3155478 RepID=UPI0033DE9CF6